MLYRVLLNLVCSLLLCALSSATKGTTETLSVTTCHTSLGTIYRKDPPRSTKHVTTTATIPILFGPRPTTTITPSPSTAQITLTTTVNARQTVPGRTNTLTATEFDTTIVSTTAARSTFTVTGEAYTTTTTVYSGFSTYPTPSGFMPILDTLPGAVGQVVVNKKRDLVIEASSGSAQAKTPLHARNFQPLPKKYPQSVDCTVYTKYLVKKPIIGNIGKPVTRTAVARTISLTSTSTTTSTSLVTGPITSATVTVTSTQVSTATSTPVITITATPTVTSTDTIPFDTTYAQCATDSGNFAGGVGNAAIRDFSRDSRFSYFTDHGATVRYCCTQCAGDPRCIFSVFSQKPNNGPTQCDLAFDYYYRFGLEPLNCPAQPGRTTAILDPNAPVGSLLVLSNGNCGVFDASE